MRSIAAAITLSSIVITAGVALSNRYEVHVSSTQNVHGAWILDAWTGETTFCHPLTGQMASYLNSLKESIPAIRSYSDAEILEFLPEQNPDLFAGLTPEQVGQIATRINSCKPGK